MVIAESTGHSFEYIGSHWDLPRYLKWHSMFGRLPPLQSMVGHYLGYKRADDPAAPTDQPKSASSEEHAATLVDSFMKIMG